MPPSDLFLVKHDKSAQNGHQTIFTGSLKDLNQTICSGATAVRRCSLAYNYQAKWTKTIYTDMPYL